MVRKRAELAGDLRRLNRDSVGPSTTLLYAGERLCDRVLGRSGKLLNGIERGPIIREGDILLGYIDARRRHIPVSILGNRQIRAISLISSR